uniref:DUF4216 domain-containing protein n=1 Tax=Parastrongyloides trichosuri TaxID=131310 RepID=A0A0N4ZRL3_PARTI
MLFKNFGIIYQNNEELAKIETLAKKLHCAMKWSGSQVITISIFRKWLLTYKDKLSLEEHEIDEIVTEDTGYGWASITNQCVTNGNFFPLDNGTTMKGLSFYTDFVVLDKVTLFDFKFDPHACTAAKDKWEAKEIKKMGPLTFNIMNRKNIFDIQKKIYKIDPFSVVTTAIYNFPSQGYKFFGNKISTSETKGTNFNDILYDIAKEGYDNSVKDIEEDRRKNVLVNFINNENSVLPNVEKNEGIEFCLSEKYNNITIIDKEEDGQEVDVPNSDTINTNNNEEDIEFSQPENSENTSNNDEHKVELGKSQSGTQNSTDATSNKENEVFGPDKCKNIVKKDEKKNAKSIHDVALIKEFMLISALNFEDATLKLSYLKKKYDIEDKGIVHFNETEDTLLNDEKDSFLMIHKRIMDLQQKLLRVNFALK